MFMKGLLQAAFFALILQVGLSWGQTPAVTCPPPFQAPTAEQSRAAQQGARNHGYLWRITKGGHSSYLYGTIHLAKFDWMFPGPDVIGALRKSDTIALELNFLDDHTSNAVQQGMKEADPPSVPVEFTAWVQQQAVTNCLDGRALAAMRPEFQVAAITAAQARQQGLEAAYGIDLMLTQLSKVLNKPLEGLETAQEQLDAIRTDQKDLQSQSDEGEFSPQEVERGQRILIRIANAWADSDLDTLAHYSEWCQCMDKADEQVEMRRLVDDRNPKMANRIDALHTAGHNLFVGVGALHLAGSKGLPALMEAHGFAVQRIF